MTSFVIYKETAQFLLPTYMILDDDYIDKVKESNGLLKIF